MPRSFPDDADDSHAPTGRNGQVVSPARVMDDLAETVRVFCRVRRVMTIEQLAQRAGIGVNRMGKLIHRDPIERRTVSASELLSIWAVLGAAGASYGLASIGMVASEDDDAGEAAARLGLAVADLFDAGADLARTAADGSISPEEANATLLACDRVEEKTAVLRRAAQQAKRR